MRLIHTASIVVLAVVGAASVGHHADPAEPADPEVFLQPEAFLQRLAGEWTVVSEAVPGPDQDPIRTEGHEVARWLGDQWLVAETSGRAPSGQSVTAILTLGWNAHEDRFVGTWISSMQSHLWAYTGTLDASGTTLTLDTEGPVLGDPERITRYREVIEVEGDDLKVMRSMILGPDGEWFEFARAEYRRTGEPPGSDPE
ncbi:MAG: DUF1579 domain-containing protein [Gemmatimonadota bacterium]